MKNADEAELARALGKSIAKRRLQSGLTQEDVAEQLEIGYEAVSRIERGVVTPSVAKLYSLAEMFGCQVSDLLNESSVKTSDQAIYMAGLIERLSDKDRKLIVEIVEKLSTRMHKKT